MTLEVSAFMLRDELAPKIREIFEESTPDSSFSAELRVELPDEWAIFWKRRESESRLLLAHPEPKQWVATLALEQATGEKLIAALEGAMAGQEIDLSKLGRFGTVSNLDFIFKIS